MEFSLPLQNALAIQRNQYLKRKVEQRRIFPSALINRLPTNAKSEDRFFVRKNRDNYRSHFFYRWQFFVVLALNFPAISVTTSQSNAFSRVHQLRAHTFSFERHSIAHFRVHFRECCRFYGNIPNSIGFKWKKKLE